MKRKKIVKFAAWGIVAALVAWGVSAIAVYWVSAGRVFDKASVRTAAPPSCWVVARLCRTDS